MSLGSSAALKKEVLKDVPGIETTILVPSTVTLRGSSAIGLMVCEDHVFKRLMTQFFGISYPFASQGDECAT